MSLSPDLPSLELTPEERRTGNIDCTDPQSKDWPALYAAGASLARIAGLTGYPVLTVRQELRVRGVTLRSPGARSGSRWGSSAWHETAMAMRACGYTYTAIGCELGQTPQAVRTALVRRAGLADTSG